MSFDVVSVGGATVDLFLLIDPQNPHIKFDKDSNELSVHLGDKVVLESSKLTVGGNANNVAVGLKKLGLNSVLIAEIGNDEFSHDILDNLKKYKIPTNLIKKTETPSSFSVVLNYEDDRTIFTRKVERNHDFSFKSLSTEWIYLTSLGKEWEGVYKKVGEFVKKKGGKLAFNPGPSQLDAGLASFSYLLPITEILIVNKEEGGKLVNGQWSMVNGDIKDLLFELKKLGPRIVVVTDGQNGSRVIDDKGEIYFQEASHAKAFSRTGAGDAYSSGFLAGLIQGKTIKEAMEWGTKNAGSVIKLIGAQTGLLNLEQMNE